jgi:hypothetical protein
VSIILMDVQEPTEPHCSPASERGAGRQADRTGEFVLRLRPVPAGRDDRGREPDYRLKIGLKRLLRNYGLRCVSVVRGNDDAG